MRSTVTRFILTAVFMLLTAFTASAAQDEVFLAKMRVTREINLGSTFEYEVESAGRGRAILKTPPYRLKVGEAINLFVVEGAKENGKSAYMTLSGHSARSFREGFAAVKVGGAWNFIDKNGRLLTQGGFDAVWDFREGFALCKLKDSYAFIGKDGKFLNTPMIFPVIPGGISDTEEPLGFNEGATVMASRTKDDNRVYIIIDRSGAVTGRINMEWVYWTRSFSEGLTPAASSSVKNAKFGSGPHSLTAYVDKTGKEIIPPDYSRAEPFSEGLAAVCVERNPNDSTGKWGFIDKSGNFVVKPQYEWAKSFSDGRAAVKHGGRWGFIDKMGNITTNISYDEAQSYSDGLAAVRRGNYWGCIDKNGQVVVKFVFYQIKPFVNGLAPTKDEKAAGWGAHWGYIDKRGNFAIKPQYKQAEPFSDGLALVAEDTPDHRGTKWKYINEKGQAALWFYMYQ